MSSPGQNPRTAMPPPEGQVTNLTDPPYIGYQGTIVCIICMVLSTTVLILRLYTRKVIVKILGYNDLLIFISWLGAMLLGVTSIAQTQYGAGKHMWDVTLEDFGVFLKLNLIIGTGYIIATCFAKISLCVFYLRLSPQRSFRLLATFMIGFTAADSLAVILVFYFACNPIAASWDPVLATMPTTTCVNKPAEYLAQAGINIFTDFAVFVLPMSTVWSLQLPLRQRIGVIAVFATGFFVCVVSIIRIRAIVIILNDPDFTWNTNNFIIWSALEVHIGVACACMATLKPILRKLFPCLHSKNSSNTPTFPEIPGRSRKLTSNQWDQGPRYPLKSYSGRNERDPNNQTTIVAGRDHSDSDADSQEHIVDVDRYGKDGVYVTTTVDIS